jgi:hypothetical protein
MTTADGQDSLSRYGGWWAILLGIGIFAVAELFEWAEKAFSNKPESYQECVLKYMPQAKDEYTARQMRAACEKQFPGSAP